MIKAATIKVRYDLTLSSQSTMSVHVLKQMAIDRILKELSGFLMKYGSSFDIECAVLRDRTGEYGVRCILKFPVPQGCLDELESYLNRVVLSVVEILTEFFKRLSVFMDVNVWMEKTEATEFERLRYVSSPSQTANSPTA